MEKCILYILSMMYMYHDTLCTNIACILNLCIHWCTIWENVVDWEISVAKMFSQLLSTPKLMHKFYFTMNNKSIEQFMNIVHTYRDRALIRICICIGSASFHLALFHCILLHCHGIPVSKFVSSVSHSRISSTVADQIHPYMWYSTTQSQLNKHS